MFSDFKLFIIRNKDGLLSTGGGNPRFQTNGKMWKTLGQVKGHLAMFRTIYGVNEVPEDWEIVEIRLEETGHTMNARELAQPHADAAKARMDGYRTADERRRAAVEKAELKRLKEKYE